MTIRFTLLALSLTLTTPAFAKIVLPDACGAEKTQFDVDTKNSDRPMAAPSEGKALVFIIQKMERSGGIFFGNETTRFGIDGAWAGANHGDSWFSVEVTPGEHHLCGNWQGKKESGAISFTAEAGKTYFFEAKIVQHQHNNTYSGPNGNVGSSSMDKGFELVTLTEDDGRFRVKAAKLSTSKVRTTP